MQKLKATQPQELQERNGRFTRSQLATACNIEGVCLCTSWH